MSLSEVLNVRLPDKLALKVMSTSISMLSFVGGVGYLGGRLSVHW